MATSKSLRARAPRKTENYVASIRRLFGEPETVPDKKFLAGKYITTGSDLGTSISNEGAYSIVEPIGFAIEINGKTYTQFSVATAGWIFLRDPAGGSTGGSFWTDILNGFTNIYDNNSISAAFSYNHIFLPVWFDRNHSVSRDVSSLIADVNGYPLTISSEIQSNIAQGIDTRYWPYDSIDYGVRYVNHYDNKKGKSLLVRWTTTQRYYGNRLKFEIALFENGTIEYRYWPIKTFEPGDIGAASSSATVGVFWHETGKQYLWRDFAPLLGYPPARTMSPLGGAIFDSSYSENGAYYSNGISSTYWPKNGAVITYSPPVKPLKILPRKIIGEMNATREIIRSPGLFDDRRTIPFVSGGLVHMPSTLPTRLMGDSGNVDVSLFQSLFVSGSASGSLFIPSNGRVIKSAIDSQLAQLEAIEKTNKVSDFSFNEGQKNYEATYTSSSFYATGSSIEEFGLGFSSPLKSKTQFSFSLPVTKQTTMPSLTSSMYYYNISRNMWDMVAPNNLQSPGRTISEPEDSLSSYEYQLVANPIYRVVETAIGFDAVGRKVVSGSNVTSTGNSSGETQQSDNALGSILNSDGATLAEAGSIFEVLYAEESKSSHTRTYKKSISDTSNYAPSSQQKINFEITEPFLLEKLTMKLPLYISGAWFNDVTTCTRAFTDNNDFYDGRGRFRGAIDFGGPGITAALFCHRSAPGVNYLDLIASGTITHINDMTSSVILKKDPDMKHYSMRPIGFNSFSNPTCIISGSNNIFDDSIKLDLIPSIAGGITIARLDRSYITSSYISPSTVSSTLVQSNRRKAVQLLTSDRLPSRGEKPINAYDMRKGVYEPYYDDRSPRVYVQQISSLSRGKTGVEFNGNSILRGTIASFNFENVVQNPLFVSTSGSLPASYSTIIDTSSDFGFEAVSIYSTVDNKSAPYLLLPGDKLTISISKTRPVIYKAKLTATGSFYNIFDSHFLTGSHDTVMLNTGSIDITLYGSYVREGVEFNP